MKSVEEVRVTKSIELCVTSNESGTFIFAVARLGIAKLTSYICLQ